MFDRKLQERVNALERHVADQNARLDAQRSDVRRLREYMQESHDEFIREVRASREDVRALTEQTNELQTLRRAIRWSIATLIAATATLSGVWRTWFKTGGS